MKKKTGANWAHWMWLWKSSQSTSGVPYSKAGHVSYQIFHAHGAKPLAIFSWAPHSLSCISFFVARLLPTSRIICVGCGQINLTDFCLLLYHWSYTILRGPLIPPMAFTSCHDRGSSRLPPDIRASTLTTQPLRLALDPSKCTSCLKNDLKIFKIF